MIEELDVREGGRKRAVFEVGGREGKGKKKWVKWAKENSVNGWLQTAAGLRQCGGPGWGQERTKDARDERCCRIENRASLACVVCLRAGATEMKGAVRERPG